MQCLPSDKRLLCLKYLNATEINQWSSESPIRAVKGDSFTCLKTLFKQKVKSLNENSD